MWGAPSGKSDYQGLLGLLPNECTDAVCDLLCPKPLRSKACLGNYSSAATAIGAAVNGRERPVAVLQPSLVSDWSAAIAAVDVFRLIYRYRPCTSHSAGYDLGL